jgi:hypothetical protein
VTQVETFTLIVFGSLLLVVLFLLAVGFGTRKRHIGELLGKRANEHWADQSIIEEGEVTEMVRSANEYRRKRGLPEMTVEDFKGQASADQQVLVEQAKKQLRTRRRKRGSGRERRGF